jgi:hypothetical protein
MFPDEYLENDDDIMAMMIEYVAPRSRRNIKNKLKAFWCST